MQGTQYSVKEQVEKQPYSKSFKGYSPATALAATTDTSHAIGLRSRENLPVIRMGLHMAYRINVTILSAETLVAAMYGKELLIRGGEACIRINSSLWIIGC